MSSYKLNSSYLALLYIGGIMMFTSQSSSLKYHMLGNQEGYAGLSTPSDRAVAGRRDYTAQAGCKRSRILHAHGRGKVPVCMGALNKRSEVL